MFSDIVIEVKDSHFWKAALPIVITLLGIVIDVRAPQCQKV